LQHVRALLFALVADQYQEHRPHLLIFLNESGGQRG
jgi:hypothetical protein